MGLLSLLFGSKKEKEKLTHFLNQKHIILDVRTEKEYKMDHIKQAIHIPLDQVETKITEIKNHNKPVIVHCQSGVRSAAGAGLLRKHGVDSVNGGGIGALRRKLK